MLVNINTPTPTSAVGSLVDKLARSHFTTHTITYFTDAGRDVVYFYDPRIQSSTHLDHPMPHLAKVWYNSEECKFKIESSRFTDKRARNGSDGKHIKITGSPDKALELLRKATAPMSIAEILVFSYARMHNEYKGWKMEAWTKQTELAPSAYGLLQRVTKDLLEYKRTGVPYTELCNSTNAPFTEAYIAAHEECARREATQQPCKAVFVENDAAYTATFAPYSSAAVSFEMEANKVAFDSLPDNLKSKCSMLKIVEPSKITDGLGMKDGPFNMFWVWED